MKRFILTLAAIALAGAACTPPPPPAQLEYGCYEGFTNSLVDLLIYADFVSPAHPTYAAEFHSSDDGSCSDPSGSSIHRVYQGTTEDATAWCQTFGYAGIENTPMSGRWDMPDNTYFCVF